MKMGNLQKHGPVIHLLVALIAIAWCARVHAANSLDSPEITSAAKLLDERKFDLALRKCNSILEKDRTNVGALAMRSVVYSRKNDHVKSFSDEQKALTLPCKTAFDESMVSKLLLARRRFDSALTHITKAIELNPHDARLYCQRSYLDTTVHDSKKAVEDVNKALQIDSHCSEAYTARSSLNRASHNFIAALADINQAIKFAPTANNYLDRALTNVRLNRFADAASDYGKAVSLEPTALAYTGRAASYLNLGQPDKAWSDLDRAIALDPYFISARKLKAQAFLAARQPAKALGELNKVERLRNLFLTVQDKLELKQTRYNAHEQMGDWTAAVDDLESILRESPSEKWALARMQQAKQMAVSTKTQPFEKTSTATSGSEAKIHDAKSHLNLAHAALKMRNYNAAIKEANRAITLEPQNCEAFLERGQAYYQSNQFGKAQADFENAALIDSKNPAPFEALAKLYRMQKDYQLAIKNYSKAIPLTKYEDDYLGRSETYLLIGKSKESLSDAEQALKVNPSSVGAMVARANANLALNQPTKALADLNFAIQLHPRSEEYLLLRANAYQKLGRQALAEKDRKAAKDFNQEIFDNAPFRAVNGK